MCRLESMAGVKYFALDDGISLVQWGGGVSVLVSIIQIIHPYGVGPQMFLGFKKANFAGSMVNLNHLFKELHIGPTLHRNSFPDFEEASLMASLHLLFLMAIAVILHYINSIGISNQVETEAT